MGNWIQAFAVLDGVLGQKHPECCSKLFRYMYFVYSAYTVHGGVAWWKYDGEFRRRMSLCPGIGVRVTEGWLFFLRLQKSTLFLAAASHLAPRAGSASVRRGSTVRDGTGRYHL